LLGRNVAGFANQALGSSEGEEFLVPREIEVAEYSPESLRVEEDVVRSNVAMEHRAARPRAMGMLHGGYYPTKEAEAARHR
jgi:acyl-coenzyme A thioesterase PaaI-like protein